MNVTMIRAKVKPEGVDALQDSVKAWFAAIDRAQPKGIRYASCQVAGEATFVILVGLEDGVENPLPAVPGFEDFQANLQSHIAEPPVVEQLAVAGSYNLF
jgi:hypothetical protein